MSFRFVANSTRRELLEKFMRIDGSTIVAGTGFSLALGELDDVLFASIHEDGARPKEKIYVYALSVGQLVRAISDRLSAILLERMLQPDRSDRVCITAFRPGDTADMVYTATLMHDDEYVMAVREVNGETPQFAIRNLYVEWLDQFQEDGDEEACEG